MGKTFYWTYYAFMSAALGVEGGKRLSSRAFDEACAVSGGDFLMVDFFQARFLATPLNLLAQKKATGLLARMDTYF